MKYIGRMYLYVLLLLSLKNMYATTHYRWHWDIHRSVEPTEKISAEISIGELIDKITILEIKSIEIRDTQKLENIHRELNSLEQTLQDCVLMDGKLQELRESLFRVNRNLWDIEDKIREKERQKLFDLEFIKLARDVYYTNDKRCAIKKEINLLTGSRIIEEKSYRPY